jgi:hypothetical protein
MSDYFHGIIGLTPVKRSLTFRIDSYNKRGRFLSNILLKLGLAPARLYYLRELPTISLTPIPARKRKVS